MALHPDGTMDVRVAGGGLERRGYTVERIGGRISRYEPDLVEGEHALHCLGDPIPTIVRAPVVSREPALDSWNGDF
jgi:hypothetical protein